MAKFAFLSGLPASEERWVFDCPGCAGGHQIRTKGKGPIWSYNGDTDKPTVSPSILTKSTKPITEAEHAHIMAGGKITPVEILCHCYVHDGRIQFLSDSTHHLAGQTVDLPDLDL